MTGLFHTQPWKLERDLEMPTNSILCSWFFLLLCFFFSLHPPSTYPTLTPEETGRLLWQSHKALGSLILGFSYDALHASINCWHLPHSLGEAGHGEEAGRLSAHLADGPWLLQTSSVRICIVHSDRHSLWRLEWNLRFFTASYGTVSSPDSKSRTRETWHFLP